MILGRVVANPTTKAAPEIMKAEDKNQTSIAEPVSGENDSHDNLPAWRRAVVKKKSVEKAQMEQAEKEKVSLLCEHIKSFTTYF